MRFVVLLFGFVGFVLTTIAAAAFYPSSHPLVVNWAEDFKLIDIVKKGEKLEVQKGLIPSDIVGFISTNDQSLTNQSHLATSLFCGIAAAFGILGTLLAFLRCGKQGGLLMLVPVLGAAVMNPFTLALTNIQMLSAFLAFFIGPLPLNASPDVDDED